MDLIDEPKGVVRLEINPEAIKDLAENIDEVGLLQPIIVRPDGERFEIVFGHRRYLAHKVLKARKIACIVRVLSDVECAIMRATENVQRVDLSPIEEAAIYADLHDTHGLSYEQVGRRMGKSGGVVKRRLDLLKMPTQLQKAVHIKAINYSVAEELWSLGDNSAIDYFLGYAVDHGATQAVVRGWVRDWKDEQRRKESGTGEGGGANAPMETRPVYVACDVCLQSMELGSETLFRTCPKCSKLITNAARGEG
jgi:ParB family chromosome partitioning protein